jgi:hypothetical protein
MGAIKSLIQGFLLATALIWTYNIAELTRIGHGALGLLYMLILLIPITSLLHMRLRKTQPTTKTAKSRRWRELIFSFQGIAFACWAFDLMTTHYAVDVTRIAVEINPLGWPLGILGAFAYYGPTVVLSYYLLFRMKESIALYASIPMTAVMLGMGAMNLIAGAENYRVFMYTVTISTDAYYGLLALIIMVNLAIQLSLKRVLTQQSKPYFRLENLNANVKNCRD